jgi:hypothetical protein
MRPHVFGVAWVVGVGWVVAPRRFLSVCFRRSRPGRRFCNRSEEVLKTTGWRPIYIVLKTTGWRLYIRFGVAHQRDRRGGLSPPTALGPPQQGLFSPASSGPTLVQRGGIILRYINQMVGYSGIGRADSVRPQPLDPRNRVSLALPSSGPTLVQRGGSNQLATGWWTRN